MASDEEIELTPSEVIAMAIEELQSPSSLVDGLNAIYLDAQKALHNGK